MGTFGSRTRPLRAAHSGRTFCATCVDAERDLSRLIGAASTCHSPGSEVASWQMATLSRRCVERGRPR